MSEHYSIEGRELEESKSAARLPHVRDALSAWILFAIVAMLMLTLG